MKRRPAARQAVSPSEIKNQMQAQAQAQRDGTLFARSVGPVTPMPVGNRAQSRAPRPMPQPRQRQPDEKVALDDLISDEFDAQSLLHADDVLSFHRRSIGAEVVRKLRRGVWAVRAHIDLHGLYRDEARRQLVSFLRDAAAHGLRCVRVVHGKGYGVVPGTAPVLKRMVPTWLVQIPEVAAFAQAPRSQGGEGALLVFLRGAEKRSTNNGY